MHFKTVRLTVIYNELNWTIFSNGGFEPLKMISKPNIGRCANKNAKNAGVNGE